jgi:hypothetical protein
MSATYAKLISKKGSQMTYTKPDTDLRFCVFCYTTTYAYICPECRDYKGLMPVADAEAYLEEDLGEYL